MINAKTIRSRAKKQQKKIISENEQLRITELNNCISILIKYFSDKPGINVWLFGSITQEFQFTPHSDIDIAIANFNNSQLGLFLELEELFCRKIDLIILEKIFFRNEIINSGLKIQ
jgi:predicted nucleotidyltransferase